MQVVEDVCLYDQMEEEDEEDGEEEDNNTIQSGVVLSSTASLSQNDEKTKGFQIIRVQETGIQQSYYTLDETLSVV